MQKFCKIHKQEQVKYYCIDEYCIEQSRVMCGKCQSQRQHKSHQIDNIEEVQNLLQEHHNQIRLFEQEGFVQIQDLCNLKIKKFLEIIEQSLMQWQKQKIQSVKNQVTKKYLSSKKVMKKFQSQNMKDSKKVQGSNSNYAKENNCTQLNQLKDINDLNSKDSDDSDYDESDRESQEEINEEFNKNQIQQHQKNKNQEEFLQFSSEENEFIMQALRDKKQNISQKLQIETILSQKFSDIELQIQKLQKFINNKFAFSMKDFQSEIKNRWNSDYTIDCPSILEYNDEQTLIYAAENKVSEEISEAHELSISALEKMNENMIVSGSYDGMIKSWCPKTGSRLQFRNQFHVSGVSCLKRLDKKHLISGDEIGNIVISNVQNNKIIRKMKNRFTSDMSQLHCIEVMYPQKTIITGSKKGQVDFWDYTQGEIIRQIKMNSEICSFFLPTSYLLMVGKTDGSITCWDCRQGVKVKTYESDMNLTAIKRLGQDTFIASYSNNKIKFFNFMSQKPFKQIEYDGEIIGIRPLYKNNQIVTLDYCELALWV